MADSDAADLRRTLAALVQLAEADLATVWAALDPAAGPSVARDALADILPALVDTYGSAAATVAADWYDVLREEADVTGRFTAIPAAIADAGTDALAGWAVGPLYTPTPPGQPAIPGTDTPDTEAWSVALSKARGGMQRRIINGARATVMGSAAEDRAAAGWQRVARGDGCPFCVMLAGRGGVYTTRDTADFGAHDDCSCMATVAWSGRDVPVRAYTPTARTITAGDRERVRDWIATH